MTSHWIATPWVRGIAALFDSTGLDTAALFAQAGLDIADLEIADARFAAGNVSTLWELAAARSGNEAIGIARPEIVQPTCFAEISYVMMSCPNLLVALERLVRYLRIVSGAADISLHQHGKLHAVNIALRGDGRPVPRARVEFVMISTLTFCRWIAGRKLHPVAADFTDPAPARLAPYAVAFQCELNFNQPVHRLVFSREDLLTPLATSNPILADLHDRYAAERLEQLENQGISHRVRDLIVRELPNGDPMRDEIARALCMTPRTLQRRLQSEGISFNDLVDETRRELAERYLRQGTVTLTQATYLLGFSDQSTFTRACKRWFGMSPGQYRARSGKPRAELRTV